MKRRSFISSLIGIAAFNPIFPRAQDGAMRRIGYIGGQSPSVRSSPLTKVFQAGLANHGWIEGKNIIIDYRWSNGRADIAEQQSKELLQSGSELIVAPEAGAYDGAHQATSKIPIIFCVHGDPIGLGHARSLARPGGNVTGLSFNQAEMSDKKLDLLLKVAPEIKTIGVIWDPGQLVNQPSRTSIELAMKSRGVNAKLAEIRAADDIDKAIDQIHINVQALFVIGSPLTFFNSEALARAVNRTKIPSIFPFAEDAQKGALLVYAPDLPDLLRRCGGYVDKVLKGAKPEDLPFEQPIKYSTIINLQTADNIGIAIPNSLVAMADQIID